MHPHREGHKHAGEWLASRMSDNDAIIDPFCWAEWYAGRTLYRIHWNPKPEDLRNHYVIWENKSESPHSRLPDYLYAKQLKEQAEREGRKPVYHWPENVPWDQAAVQVWKLGPE
jgi:hypothetical protein